RRGIEHILEWDFDRVTVTHGQVLEADGNSKLREAYAWLLK
ncbi:MAG: methanol oxidase, glmU, partial [Proteobacteria bacterium]|nr:methanol oxidase, glmU [Pseudomonadota bacterium]